MMKKLIVTALLLLPIVATAQNVWEVPNAQAGEEVRKTEKEVKPEKENPDKPYLRGVVPEVDGKVAWTYQIEAPGKSAQELFDRTCDYFNRLSKEEGQLEGSGISLVNRQEHIVVASIREWMTFRTSLLSLDRTKIYYRVVVTCKDGAAEVVADRISFRYEEERNPGAKPLKAEEWISDKAAVSKKNKLYKGSAKFRRKTVDRMNELRESLSRELTK